MKKIDYVHEKILKGDMSPEEFEIYIDEAQKEFEEEYKKVRGDKEVIPENAIALIHKIRDINELKINKSKDVEIRDTCKDLAKEMKERDSKEAEIRNWGPKPTFTKNGPIDVYQQETSETAIYPKDKALEYLTLGLVGEAGEIANKVKKVLRGDKEADEAFRKDLKAELGDVLWYMAQICETLDISLGEVAVDNIKKLKERKKANKIKGDGDNR